MNKHDQKALHRKITVVIMPKLQDILDCLVSMQGDLQKTDDIDLLGNDDTFAAWIKLTEYVKNRQKDKLESGFNHLEGVIHRDFRVPPKRLHEERQIYTSDRKYLCETKQTVKDVKTHNAKKIGATPKPTSLTKEIKKKVIPKQDSEKRHEAIHRDNDVEQLRQLQQECEERERQLIDTRERLHHAETENENLMAREKTHPLKKRYEEMERLLKHTQERLRQAETDNEYFVDRSKLQADQTSTGESYPNDVCQAQVAHADTKVWAYKQKIETLERELKDTQATLRRAEIDKERSNERLDKVINTPSSPAQWETDNHNRQPHNKLVHLKDGKQEKEAAERLEVLEQEHAKLHNKIQTLNQDLQSLIKDRNALKTRMSKMAGDKLTHNNPAITDLSDPNRPQKLAEKYGELYDNEWTDAIDKLNPRKEEKQDRACIDTLSLILKFCYSECKRIADSQLSQLVMDCVNLKIPTKQQEKPPEGSAAIKRFLLDAQHSSSVFTMRAAVDSVKASLTRAKEVRDKAKQIPLYNEKCIEICWSMVTHYPRLFLLWPDVSKDKQIRFDMFHAYTRSGDTLEFVVWPALLLYKDGPLLRKGTVQPVAR